MRVKIKRELALACHTDGLTTDVGEQPHKARLTWAADRSQMTENG
jgi:hypothetical protein